MDTSGDEKMDEKSLIESFENNEEDEEDEEDEDDDSGQGEGQEASTSNAAFVRKTFGGQTCTLKTLIDDGVVESSNAALHMEYMGTKFTADLLPNGTIRWPDTNQVFSTPSSWVNHCKKIINPENSGKTGSAWSTIKYRGKRLDSYKLRWYRKQKKFTPPVIATANVVNLVETPLSYTKCTQEMTAINSTLIREQLPTVQNFVDDYDDMKNRNIIEHCSLPMKSILHDLNVMVKCIPFSAMDRIQPFTVTISTNALLLIDFHCHLTTGEVVGYLGGNWDISAHNLSILQAFPCRSRLGDKQRAAATEEEIKQNLDQKGMNVVGWYHSHPNSAAQPTVKDIESQMEYQIAMKGESDSAYIPCIGLICSPYDEYNRSCSSTYLCYWVMPPPEYRPQEYGKPMQMVHTVARDSFLTQDLLLEMRLLAHFYMDGADAIQFKEQHKSDKSITFWEKLQISLQPNLPRDLQMMEGQTSAQAQVQQQALSHFWAFLKGLIYN